MKIPLRPIAFALIIFLVSSCSQKQTTKETTASTVKEEVPPAGADERERIAADIVTNQVKGDYAAVRKDFAKIMLDGISEEKLKSTWDGLIAKIGAFQKVVSTKEVQLDGYTVIKKRCQFASENATLQVTFNEENKVIGLYIKM